MTSIENIIIYKQAKSLAENEVTGVAEMLKQNKENELRDIYRLFKRVKETLDFIAKKLTNYLEQHGNQFNSEAEQKK